MKKCPLDQHRESMSITEKAKYKPVSLYDLRYGELFYVHKYSGLLPSELYEEDEMRVPVIFDDNFYVSEADLGYLWLKALDVDDIRALGFIALKGNPDYPQYKFFSLTVNGKTWSLQFNDVALEVILSNPQKQIEYIGYPKCRTRLIDVIESKRIYDERDILTLRKSLYGIARRLHREAGSNVGEVS